MKRSLLIYVCLLATILLTSSPAQAQSTKRVDLCELSIEIPLTWEVNYDGRCEIQKKSELVEIEKKESVYFEPAPPPSQVIKWFVAKIMTAKKADIFVQEGIKPFSLFWDFELDSEAARYPEKLITEILRSLPEGQMIVRPTRVKLDGQDAMHMAFRYRKQKSDVSPAGWSRLDIWMVGEKAVIAMHSPLDQRLNRERQALVDSIQLSSWFHKPMVVNPADPTPAEPSK